MRSHVEYRGLVVDALAREVLVDGEVVELCRREFDLLWFLACHPRQVFTRGQLLQQVWASSEDWQSPTTVTEHVGRLRRKIERAGRPPRFRTVWGVGYRFEPDRIGSQP